MTTTGMATAIGTFLATIKLCRDWGPSLCGFCGSWCYPYRLGRILTTARLPRSPWSNEYDPPLEDGTVPSSKLRKLEITANEAFDTYREMHVYLASF